MYMYVYSCCVYLAHVCSLNKGGIFSVYSTRAVPSISNWNGCFLFHNHFHLGHSNSFSLLLCAEALSHHAICGNTFHSKNSWSLIIFPPLLLSCHSIGTLHLAVYNMCIAVWTDGSHFDQPEM